jgi:hypothetical protein
MHCILCSTSFCPLRHLLACRNLDTYTRCHPYRESPCRRKPISHYGENHTVEYDRFQATDLLLSILTGAGSWWLFTHLHTNLDAFGVGVFVVSEPNDCGSRKFVLIGGQGLTVATLLVEFVRSRRHLLRFPFVERRCSTRHGSGHDATHQTMCQFLDLDFQASSGPSSRESGVTSSPLRVPTEYQEAESTAC